MMHDREKTALGIREMIMRDTWRDIDADRPRYQRVLNDALAMLKEQEPTEPVFRSDEWRCHNCSTIVLWYTLIDGIEKNMANYCPRCGTPVKWD